MDKEIYRTFNKFLEELKTITGASEMEPDEKAGVISDIDKMIAEFDESKTERDNDLIKTLLQKLEKVEVIGELVKSSRDIAENIYLNK